MRLVRSFSARILLCSKIFRRVRALRRASRVYICDAEYVPSPRHYGKGRMPRRARKPSAAAKNSKRRGTHGRFPRGARKDSRAGTRAKHGYALMLLNLSVRVSRTVRRGCGGRRPGCSSPCHRLYGATSHKCLLLPRFGRFVRVSASFPRHYNKLPASRNQPEERALHAREQTMRERARAGKMIFLKPAENTRLHEFHRSP